MRQDIASALLVTLMLSIAPAVCSAEEELFDTKAFSEHMEKGIAFLKAKNYDAAVKEFEESAEVYPDAEPYYYLGYAYYLKGKDHNDPASRKKSIENFDKAYEIDPNFTPSRFKPAEPAPVEAKQQQQKAAAPEGPAPEPVPAPEQPAQPAEEPAQQPSGK